MNIRKNVYGLVVSLLGIVFLSQAHAQDIRFNSLLSGSQFLAPATFRLSAYAVAATGRTIQKVEFFNGTTSLGVATLSSMANIYTLDVPNQGVGTYTIKAVSTDNLNTIRNSSAFTVTVRMGKAYGTPDAVTPVPLYTTSSPYGYNEYLPKGYAENDAVKKWPLVISLHGQGGIPPLDKITGQVKIDQLNQALDGLLQNIKMDGLNIPAVVLEPQSGASGVAGIKEWGNVDEFITYALSQYNVDPDRVYLAGQSFGSNLGALTYAGGGSDAKPNARRLAALFPTNGGSFNASKAQGTRMANVPMWIVCSWGDTTGSSIGSIQAVDYAAGATPYKDVTDASIVVTLPDLLFSFSSVGKEVVDNGVPKLNTLPLSSPTYIPVQGDTIDAVRTVSYVNNSWSWRTGYQRDPASKIMLTLLDGFTHPIWNSVLAQGDRLTWVFLQTRAPGVRTVFSAARFNTTRALVNQAYTDTLAPKVTAPRGATFARDIKGPAWLKIAPDGTLSGTPGVADLGINTWDITVTTTDANNVPITESAELLLFVEAPGYNDWWQKQNGNTALGIPAINSGPAGDDDGDGLSNLFEYVTGSDPLKSVSDPLQPGASFKVSIAPVAGNPLQTQITYGPLIKNQTYLIKSTDSLTSGSWKTEDTFKANSALTTKVVTITNASTPKRFYKVEINKP